MKPPRAETLGHIAGAVHSDEEEGDAACIRFLKRGEAVGDLFKACAEPMAEQLNVIFRCFAFTEEARIRHQQRGGEVIC